MFSHIQPEILDRIFHTEIFLKDVCTSSVPTVTKTAKGLVFVQLYSVYEFTVTQCFSAAIRTVSTYSIPAINIRPEVLSVALDSQWDSLRDTSKRRSWDKRIRLLQYTRDNIPVSIPDDIFPFDDSHFRTKQLETIWSVLGILLPTLPKPIHIGRIQEVVEHRNAIAHGRETADKIGSRFTQNELRIRISDMQNICLYILDTIEAHCADMANLNIKKLIKA